MDKMYKKQRTINKILDEAQQQINDIEDNTKVCKEKLSESCQKAINEIKKFESEMGEKIEKYKDLKKGALVDQMKEVTRIGEWYNKKVEEMNNLINEPESQPSEKLTKLELLLNEIETSDNDKHWHNESSVTSEVQLKNMTRIPTTIAQTMARNVFILETGVVNLHVSPQGQGCQIIVNDNFPKVWKRYRTIVVEMKKIGETGWKQIREINDETQSMLFVGDVEQHCSYLIRARACVCDGLSLSDYCQPQQFSISRPSKGDH
ncbi:hypothetical protein RFI_24124 [Reticulomyxa filosa]|uniref:Uncharacterized protein n=1 Tax=Reticulomyxa filosa TaxID=46433 RepID=X6MGV6_RETFI|nr:hypothetical protein RFI_24124 [Reticulomyxa filosa]|eukprot:ETO13253.1 hypothetical protein RFI_24124 [Reticulomyxa filosa]